MGPSWDNVIALSYAAEQLFMAGQLLTSDTVPLPLAVQQVCDRHLTRLKQHGDLLPAYVNTWIAECIASCARMRDNGQFRVEYASELSTSICHLLDEIRVVLKQLGGELPEEKPAA